MSVFKVTYRSILLASVMIAGCIFMIIGMNKSVPTKSNKLGQAVNRWWHKAVTRIMGVEVEIFGEPEKETTLYIANHISWLDINALGSVMPTRFLAKVEVKKMPVMGWLASRAGTLYIQRGGKDAANQTIDTMTNALNDSHHIVLFAEGTTQDGNVGRFHSRLVQSAINANCKIQPVAIRYPSLNGERVHPAALFVGETTIAESIKKMMSAKNLRAELHFLEPISVDGKTRSELASYAESKVREIIDNATLSKQKNPALQLEQ